MNEAETMFHRMVALAINRKLGPKRTNAQSMAFVDGFAEGFNEAKALAITFMKDIHDKLEFRERNKEAKLIMEAAQSLEKLGEEGHH